MRIIHIIAAFFVLIATPALAKDGPLPWIVAQKSGDVRVLHNGMQPASVQVRAALSPGDVIATGANGRAMLTRGDDYVVVAPGSRLLLPKEEQARGFTRLLQQVGTMFYKVKHTGVPHFAVETPMLAAVVKGTSFSVVVDKDRAAVQVTDGIVEVSSLAGDARRLVEKGLTVYIGRERPNQIIEIKPGVTVPQSSSTSSGGTVKVERSGDVPLSTVVSLTDGLVKEAPVAVATNTQTDVLAPTSAAIVPATDTVKAIIPAVTVPGVDVVDSTVPAVVEPVADVVGTTVPAVVEPVVDIVQTTVPTVVEPIVDIVQTTVPTVVEPVVEVVETTVPTVIEPVVEIVDAVIQPVVGVVETITEPVLGLVGGLLGGSDNSGPGSTSSGSGSGGLLGGLFGGSNSGPGGGGGG